MSRPQAYGTNLPSMHLKALIGIATPQRGNNNEDIVGPPGSIRSSASGIQIGMIINRRTIDEISNSSEFNEPMLAEAYSDELSDISFFDNETTKSLNNNNLTDAVARGVKLALGIKDPVLGYKPNKESRDLNRLISLNRIPLSKTWSKEEIEYYNRKGSVSYPVKNVEKMKIPPQNFNPLAPELKYINQSAISSLVNKPNFNVMRDY